MGIIDNLCKQMIERGVISETEKEIYSYGIRNGIMLFCNIITTITIGIISGKLVEILIFAMAFIPLRSYAGGYHIDSKAGCYIVSTLMLLLPICAEQIIGIMASWVPEVLFLLSVAAIYILCPVECKERKMDKEENACFSKRAKMIIACQIFVIFVCTYLRLYKLIYSIYISTYMITIFILIRELEKLLNKEN